MNELLLYTDGSCSAKTKQGGWAWILKKQYGSHLETIDQNSCGNPVTTISRMEMTAVLDGLLNIIEKGYKESVSVISDSQFIVNAINKGWFEQWKQTDFIGRPNDDLWKVFEQTLPMIPSLRFIHTRGHGKGMEYHIVGNEEVDHLCSYKNFFPKK